MKKMLSIATVLLSWAGVQGGEGELHIGDPAPKLAVKEFLKGDSVKDLQKGKIYVVELWAVGCAPCRTAVPHLTELQKRHPDVVFIGVNIDGWRSPQEVKAFVKEMGETMNYRVALGDVGDAMMPIWMEAAGEKGIPVAFIINKERKTAWIGHPETMDEPLKRIIADDWDLAAAAKKHEERVAAVRKIQHFEKRLAAMQKAGDLKKLSAFIDETLKDDPAQEMKLGPMKFQALLGLADVADEALDYGRHLAKDLFDGDAEGLCSLAKIVIAAAEAKSKVDEELIQLALEAALQADKMAHGENVSIADALARVYFIHGDPAKAAATQERAVQLNAKQTKAVNPDLNKRLEQYKYAAKKL